MIAYKKYVTIQDPKQMILSDLPFRPGQVVEVVIIADKDFAIRRQELQSEFAMWERASDEDWEEFERHPRDRSA